MTIWFVPHVMWCLRGTAISLKDLAAAVIRPVVATAIAAGLAYGAQLHSAGLSSTFLRVMIGATVMLTAYLGILMFVLGQKRFYVDLLRGLLKPSPVGTKG